MERELGNHAPAPEGNGGGDSGSRELPIQAEFPVELFVGDIVVAPAVEPMDVSLVDAQKRERRRQQCREARARWRERHPDAYHAAQQRWRENNPEASRRATREAVRRYRERKRQQHASST